jgi:hypothetical protein
VKNDILLAVSKWVVGNASASLVWLASSENIEFLSKVLTLSVGVCISVATLVSILLDVRRKLAAWRRERTKDG